MSEPTNAPTPRLDRETLEQAKAAVGALLHRGSCASKEGPICMDCAAFIRAIESISKLAALPAPAPVDPLAQFCQSEGPRGETICMLLLGHDGPCGWERVKPAPVETPGLIGRLLDCASAMNWEAIKADDVLWKNHYETVRKVLREAAAALQSGGATPTCPWTAEQMEALIRDLHGMTEIHSHPDYIQLWGDRAAMVEWLTAAYRRAAAPASRPVEDKA